MDERIGGPDMDTTFAPAAHWFRAMALVIGSILTLVMALAIRILLDFSRYIPAADRITRLTIVLVFFGLGVRLIHLTFTCRNTYPVQRGFPIATVAVDDEGNRSN